MTDISFFSALNSITLKSEILDTFIVFCAEYLGYILILSLFIFLIKDFKQYKYLPVAAIFSGGLSRLVVEVIRAFIFRNRPFVNSEIIPLFEHAETSSFPSGHAAFFFGLSFIVSLYNKNAGRFFLFSSLLISVSRVVSGIHWPSDIIFGALIGFFVAMIVRFSLLKKTNDI